METESIVLIVVAIVLFEYALHLRGRIEKTAKEKFEEWRSGYLANKGESDEPTPK